MLAKFFVLNDIPYFPVGFSAIEVIEPLFPAASVDASFDLKTTAPTACPVVRAVSPFSRIKFVDFPSSLL